MRTFILLASAALVSTIALTGAARADDRLHLTPPLYREQARVTQQTRAASDLTTTPQVVAPVPSAAGKVSSIAPVMDEASAR